jgi:UDP-2,4-diacetamido-2,4,6-trideoxy-beta-L-altropyranose hydrolase
MPDMPTTKPTEYSSAIRGARTPARVNLVADGGSRVGYGHVGRCLALAEALGDFAAFSVEDSNLEAFLNARQAPIGGTKDASVIVLDRAEPTSAAEVRALQADGRRVVLLDDLGSGRRYAELVIDPPTAASWPPTAGSRLAGFEHVLLRDEVLRADRSPAPAGLLLGLGGSDPSALTPVLAEALPADGLIVNLGPGYRGPRPGHGELLADPTAFVQALSGVKLLVASYGHTLLEAAYLGVPALFVATREDQVEHAEAFAQNGTAELVQAETAAARAEQLLADPAALEAMSDRGRSLVDGRGAERVAAEVRALTT